LQGVYVTGGSSVLPNLAERLQRELTALLPFQEPLNIVTDWPGESTTSAWKGMASWSRTAEAKAAAVTRAEWHEMGPGYLKEHRWGNWADEVAT
jgi:actin-related protein 5